VSNRFDTQADLCEAELDRLEDRLLFPNGPTALRLVYGLRLSRLVKVVSSQVYR
jgi:hypothetical protein